MGGLEPEDKYPYKGANGTCHLVRKEIAVTIDDAVEIPRNETVMKAWIAQRGPLSVGKRLLDIITIEKYHYKEGNGK